ncbi:MAG: hypothetical protein KBT03_13185 [Bacteroidales bacterium]|nr:hypothetical protein [Candidatus Scybalousia scybalohippi]
MDIEDLSNTIIETHIKMLPNKTLYPTALRFYSFCVDCLWVHSTGLQLTPAMYHKGVYAPNSEYYKANWDWKSVHGVSTTLSKIVNTEDGFEIIPFDISTIGEKVRRIVESVIEHFKDLDVFGLSLINQDWFGVDHVNQPIVNREMKSINVLGG